MSMLETVSTETKAARILVVEDEAVVAKDIERTLVTIGYDVVGRVAEGEQAIAEARACRPDLILMDIHLRGEVDGIAAASAIREELQTPVLFLTAFSDRDTVSRATTTEPFAYILKPFKEPELRCAIEIALNKSRTDALLRQMNDSLEQRVVERTAELIAANEEMEGFAYAVAHDLRAPLRAMTGFAEALTEDLGPDVTAEAAADLAQIHLASANMGALIDGLLMLSRCTRGDLQRSAIDLSTLSTRLLRRLTAADPARTVEWSVEPGLTAHGDARMIESVMANLLENAWKFTGRAATPAIRVYADRNGPETLFCVADSGAGFDMRHADRLFKPFQRLHRQEEFPGTGIGLATVQRIVRRHGGTIRATGTVGCGATFSLSLPSAQQRKTS
jgi:light-regulated signal transduction histidine kinase (bacteriophytochrome)